MQYLTSYRNIPDESRGSVLVIGNFDGVHRGHQVLLEIARKKALSLQKPLGVLTFEPHPRRFFKPDDPPFRITPPPVKTRRLERGGAEIVYALPFDADMAGMEPERFINDILRDGLGAKHLVVGHDFRFGHKRAGDSETLTRHGYEVTVIEEVGDEAADQGEGKYSSTSIRECLRAGNIKRASHLLGWPWEIEGEVSQGDRRGRELGYPTANVALGETVHPVYGIYACFVKIVDEGSGAQWRPAAANIGIRPMFEIPTAQIEAYIFDFDREIYGSNLRIRAVQKIRDEARFDNLESLKQQMAQDCDEARQILGRHIHLGSDT